MALIKGTGANSLAKNWYDNLSIESKIDNSPGIPADLKTTQKAESLTELGILADTLIDHIITNMSIKGITISDPAGVIESYVLGVGTNGGSMVATPYPVVGNVAKPAQTLSQNNDGTGHVE